MRLLSHPRDVAAILAVFLVARAASGGLGLPLTLDELSSRADLVVVGRVTGLTSGFDPRLNGIYTTVTIEPVEVFKGRLADDTFVLKQLGGIAGSRGAYVHGQATFVEGEQVLLFLGTRERDASLFTLGLWQGKWTVEFDAGSGQLAALKREPRSGGAVERHALGALRQQFSRLFGESAHRVVDGRSLSADPRRQSSAFALNDPPIRWPSSSVSVNVDSGVPPRLPGGGLGEISAAVAQWNAAASSLVLRPGSRLPPRCQHSAGSDIIITFNDPCGEISIDPSLLAVTVFGFLTEGGQVVNGRLFLPITDVVITTSANPAVQPWLATASCFQSTIAHELGHAIGLGHTPDATALMYFQEMGACLQGPIPLAPDDLAGLFAIYPPGGPPPAGGGIPGQSTVTAATAAGGVLSVAWTTAGGATPTSHRLDFFSGSALVATVTVGPSTTATIPIPPGTVGTFAVQVTAVTGSTPGAPSPHFPFTIGGAPGGVCTIAPAAPIVSGALIGGTATVSWTAVPGAVYYIISAGTSQGAANIAPAANVGSTTVVTAGGLPPGFNAWVRVIAVNACGQSAPADFFLSSGPPAMSPAAGFLRFLPGTDACACWTNAIVLEVDGQPVGTMSCTAGGGPFPLSAGAHVYRACDALGCYSSNVAITAGSTVTFLLACQLSSNGGALSSPTGGGGRTVH